jgi:hypothetical protein
MRSSLHIEARHTTVPEHLLRDIAGSIARTGALIHATISACVVLSPEHADLLHDAGWDKPDIQRFLFDEAINRRAHLDRVGKGAVSRQTRWRLPADHPDAVVDTDNEGPDTAVRALASPAAVLVVVAGAANAGVSTVIETFGPRGGRPVITQVDRNHASTDSG